MRQESKLTHLGRRPDEHSGVVNIPVFHASTVVFPSLAELERRGQAEGKEVVYGLHGTPITFALEDALAELEGGADAALFPSGLAAIAMALMAFLKPGDHLLMVDSVYGPTRMFCDKHLAGLGVTTTYYDPLIGEGLAELMRPETKVVFLESPGSVTFEVQDAPAICGAARAGGAVSMIDNTWATPLYFKPFEHGLDVSIQAGTKYIGGHSDLMMGSVCATGEHFPAIRRIQRLYGQNAAPDDCFLALRGLRTMAVRLPRHQQTGLALAAWLAERPEVARVLHPALDSCPGHDLFARDFSGASGLFSVELAPCSKKALAAMLDEMTFFKMGFSWGGFESLAVPYWPKTMRSATGWAGEGPVLRLHAGLEDPADLIEDLAAGFERLARAQGSAN